MARNGASPTEPPADMTLRIIDMNGQQVRTLICACFMLLAEREETPVVELVEDCLDALVYAEDDDSA